MSIKIRECFESARKDEEKGKKHKGLLIVETSSKKAEEYLDKARDSLRFCEICKSSGSDYKIPEECFGHFMQIRSRNKKPKVYCPIYPVCQRKGVN